MSSPIFSAMNNGNQLSQFMSQFNQFRRNYQGINPKDEVMKALQSGKINQQQLNEFQRMANQIGRYIK